MQGYRPVMGGGYMPSPVFADVAPRSPIGGWQKTPTNVEDAPATLALAAMLEGVPTTFAVDHAAGVLHRLYRWVARLPGQHLRGVPASTIALAVRWQGDADTLVQVLRDTGVLDEAGHVAHLAYITGNVSREDVKREANRQRQARWRARHRPVGDDAGTVTRNAGSVTKRYVASTSVPSSEGASNVRAGARASVEPRKLLTPGRNRLHDEAAPSASNAPARAVPMTVPSTIVEQWHPAVRAAHETLALIVGTATQSAISNTVGDDGARLRVWRRVLNTWASQGWHAGEGAVTAMLDRFARQVDAPTTTTTRPPVVSFSPGTPPPTPLPTSVPPVRTDAEVARLRAAFRAQRDAIAEANAHRAPARLSRPTTTTTTTTTTGYAAVGDVLAQMRLQRRENAPKMPE